VERISSCAKGIESKRVTVPTFDFDEIGYWSELKLEIVEKYGSAYTNRTIY